MEEEEEEGGRRQKVCVLSERGRLNGNEKNSLFCEEKRKQKKGREGVEVGRTRGM